MSTNQNITMFNVTTWSGFLDQWDFTVGKASKQIVTETEIMWLTKCAVLHLKSFIAICLVRTQRYNHDSWTDETEIVTVKFDSTHKTDCSRAVKKYINKMLNIRRISNKNSHSNAKRCIRILGVHQAAFQWHTKWDDVGMIAM